MDSETKRDFRFALIAALLVMFFLLLFRCNKENDQIIVSFDTTVTNTLSSKLNEVMTPGPDPEFVNSQNDNLVFRSTPYALAAVTWKRSMYVDKTDTFYSNAIGKAAFARYVRRYGFTGLYFYSTSGIVASTSNYSNFASFLKLMSDNGVTERGVASGGSSTFQTSGNVTRYNNSQTDINKKINVANLELEWWNGGTSWASWNTINQQNAAGTIAYNDFYEGWYKNLGTTIDTIAAKDQVRYSDRILLHCYQNGVPTYSYANAQSTGATGGRLDIIAKGARQEYIRTGIKKKVNLRFIISSEFIAAGAANNFSGIILQQNNTKPNPFEYIEQLAYNNIVLNMTAFQKEWINFEGFVWFDKRYNYAAVNPI